MTLPARSSETSDPSRPLATGSDVGAIASAAGLFKYTSAMSEVPTPVLRGVGLCRDCVVLVDETTKHVTTADASGR